MTRLVLWLLARGLVLTARHLAPVIGMTPEGYGYLHTGEWYAAPARDTDHTVMLGGLYPRAITVTDLVRCGPAVLAREWTPDGGPCVYVLDASQETDPPEPEPDPETCYACGRELS